MQIYTMKVTCHVCGGEGAATPNVATSQWFKGNFISHRDPQVCADNLKRKEKERLQKEEEERNNKNSHYVR